MHVHSNYQVAKSFVWAITVIVNFNKRNMYIITGLQLIYTCFRYQEETDPVYDINYYILMFALIKYVHLMLNM